MKRILWVLAALLVLLCGVAAAEGTTIVGSGNCGAIGSSVTWQLDSAGTLTIAGTGDMEDYPGSTYVPWYFNRSSIRSAVVQEGVESIGDNTFYGCSGYPECDFVSWDLPAPYFCPECKEKGIESVMKMTKTKSGRKYTCTNKDCNHTEVFKDGGEQ